MEVKPSRFLLKPHPQTADSPLISFRAFAHRVDRDLLNLSYIVAGAMEEIAWPGNAIRGWDGWTRGSELWQHTCFEAFARIENWPGYRELNFTTAGKWAAYELDGYREGMRAVADIKLERALWSIGSRRAEIHALLRVPDGFANVDWHIGLSAVIEEKSGRKSYWALAHPADKPDFHDPACFTATLPAPRAA